MAALRSAAPVIEPAGAVELRDALAAAELYVGNDSGASHLAAAVAAPTVAVFGPTDPRRWRPLGEHVTVVRRGAASWPSVDEVLEAAHRRLLALCP
jgi:ADP-heptose:LPS heptosyltransferase